MNRRGFFGMLAGLGALVHDMREHGEIFLGGKWHRVDELKPVSFEIDLPAIAGHYDPPWLWCSVHQCIHHWTSWGAGCH